MLAVSILDLRQIGLADRSEPLFLDGPHDFLLSHLAAKTAQRPFHLPQVPKFFTEIHIADCDITIAICNKQAKKIGGEFQGRTPNSEVQEFGVRPWNSCTTIWPLFLLEDKYMRPWHLLGVLVVIFIAMPAAAQSQE